MITKDWAYFTVSNIPDCESPIAMLTQLKGRLGFEESCKKQGLTFTENSITVQSDNESIVAIQKNGDGTVTCTRNGVVLAHENGACSEKELALFEVEGTVMLLLEAFDEW